VVDGVEEINHFQCNETMPIASGPIIHIHPCPMAAHRSPAPAHSAHNDPSIDTTCSLPRTASLNFCTNGTRVWFASFQNAAMCVRVKASINAFAALAENRNVGDEPYDVVARTRGVRKDTIN
jgi:hypothetical protein